MGVEQRQGQRSADSCKRGSEYGHKCSGANESAVGAEKFIAAIGRVEQNNGH